jgi:site-specific DNA recombinase
MAKIMQNATNNNKEIYVIGYARVSSDKQARIGEGLERQEADIKDYCKSKGWILFPENKIFRESFTGTNTNRPVYNQILELLKNNKGKINIKYLVFWEFDRLTRAGIKDYNQIWSDLSKYNVSLRDTRDVIQEEKDLFAKYRLNHTYEFALERPSEDTETQKVEDARKDRLAVLRKLTPPQIERVQDGYHIGKPDYGFRNKWIYVDNKKKCIQERREDEAKYVEKIFYLRAEGLKTDDEIADIVNKQGYKSRERVIWSEDEKTQIGTTGNVKMNAKQVQQIIIRPVYAGILSKKMNNYKPIRAKYSGLLDIDTWNKANRGKLFIKENNDGSIEILRNIGVHSKKRNKLNPEYPYKGILVCEICRKEMKASASTGKSKKGFPVYHCERFGHKRNSIKKVLVHEAFSNLFNRIMFTNDFMEILRNTLLLKKQKEEAEASKINAEINKHLSDLQTKKSQLIASFANATLVEVQKSIEEEIVNVKNEIESITADRNKQEAKEKDIEAFINWISKIMEHPNKILEDIRTPDEQRELFSIFFEEKPTYTDLINGTPKLTFIFKLNEAFKTNKSYIAGDEGIEPALAVLETAVLPLN